MCKSELFNSILQVVEQETEIADVLHNKSRTLEVVDARYLLVYFLRNYAGYNNGYIAERMNMTNQGINKILRNFDTRRRQNGNFFEATFQRIRNQLSTNFQPSRN
ncbi:MAG: hypothetical protein J1E33_06580 [Alistipes sp.]|nr:hypothetical protein [Alistipes sp.]